MNKEAKLRKIRKIDPETDKELIEAIKLKDEALDRVSGGRKLPEEEGVTCPGCGSDNIYYVGYFPEYGFEVFQCMHCGDRFLR